MTEETTPATVQQGPQLVGKYDTMWYLTKLPKQLIDQITKEIDDGLKNTELTTAGVGSNSRLDPTIRNNRIAWLNDNHWIAAFISYYIMKANQENFKYNLSHFSDHAIQFSLYETDEHYGWHTDGMEIIKDPIHGEMQRKLSVSLQLSDESEYEGGELQFLNTGQNSMYTAPKERGKIIIFDSRVKHRVRPITKGARKSLVAWMMGPRWK